MELNNSVRKVEGVIAFSSPNLNKMSEVGEWIAKNYSPSFEYLVQPRAYSETWADIKHDMFTYKVHAVLRTDDYAVEQRERELSNKWVK